MKLPQQVRFQIKFGNEEKDYFGDGGVLDQIYQAQAAAK
jgi:hypothetical protein